MKTLKIGIATYQQMKARTLAIARGELRPASDEPKVWFTSIESFAKILSDRNRELLSLIAERQPKSLTELAEMSGRAKSNLSRTLKTMEGYGLVELEKDEEGKTVPHVPYDDIALAVTLSPKDHGAEGRA
jgi:predicted transcriptional regulator